MWCAKRSDADYWLFKDLKAQNALNVGTFIYSPNELPFKTVYSLFSTEFHKVCVISKRFRYICETIKNEHILCFSIVVKKVIRLIFTKDRYKIKTGKGSPLTYSEALEKYSKRYKYKL